MSLIEAKCPFCEWSSRQSTGKQDAVLIQSYICKALMMHLRLKHSRHDEVKIQDIAFSTILSATTKEGRIEFSIDDVMSQWDLDKAREIHKMLGEAIEAAVSDTIMFRFLTQKVGLDDSGASAALMDLREIRQGSRDKVRPN